MVCGERGTRSVTGCCRDCKQRNENAKIRYHRRMMDEYIDSLLAESKPVETTLISTPGNSDTDVIEVCLQISST